MINILDVCNSSAIVRIIYYFKIIINIICLIVPIILIVTCMISVIKAVIDKDNNAISSMLSSWAKKSIAAIIIFFIPTFINLIVRISDENSTFKSCYESASLEKANSLQKTEDAQTEKEISKWKAEQERKRKEEEERKRLLREQMAASRSGTGSSSGGSGGSSDYGTTWVAGGGSIGAGGLTRISLTDLGCPVTYAGTPLSSFKVHSQVANSVHSTMASWCNGFVKSHSNLTNRIETAGAYTDKPGYHGRGLAIDFYNNWVYYENGKKYTPYAGQGQNTWYNYKKFICEVCNGQENCTKNINYHLYYSYFKQIGWCWGGNWTSGYFDPMHYEKTDGGCSFASSNRISCN